MPIWVKAVIAVWLYLSVGYGVLLINQVLGYKHPDMFMYVDVDDEDSGSLIVAIVFLWPLMLLLLAGHFIDLFIKHILKLVDQELREEDDKWPKN